MALPLDDLYRSLQEYAALEKDIERLSAQPENGAVVKHLTSHLKTLRVEMLRQSKKNYANLNTMGGKWLGEFRTNVGDLGIEDLNPNTTLDVSLSAMQQIVAMSVAAALNEYFEDPLSFERRYSEIASPEIHNRFQRFFMFNKRPPVIKDFETYLKERQ